MSTRLGARGMVLLFVLATLAGACGSPALSTPSPIALEATPTVAPTSTPTATPSATAIPTPTATPSPTPTLEPDPEPTPTPTMQPLPDARTGRITLDEVGLTLTLPKGWKSLALNGDDVQGIFAAVPEGMFPDGFADQVGSMVAAGLRLWAFDFRPHHLGANVNVLVTDRIDPSLLPLTAKLGISIVNGAKLTGSKALTIDGQPCYRLDIQVTAKVKGHTLVMNETQLYLTRPHSTAVITIAIPKGGSMADLAAIVNSVHLHD